MTTELARQRREEILGAAAKCFIRKGIHATSMSDIARGFGMSTGHIYNYFMSKSAIIEAIVERGTVLFYKLLAEIRDADGDRDKLERLIKMLFVRDREKQYFLLSLEILCEARREPALFAFLAKSDQQAREYLRDASLECRDAVQSEFSHEVRIEFLLGVLEGIGLRTLRNPKIDIDEMSRYIARVITEKSFP